MVGLGGGGREDGLETRSAKGLSARLNTSGEEECVVSSDAQVSGLNQFGYCLFWILFEMAPALENVLE